MRSTIKKNCFCTNPIHYIYPRKMIRILLLLFLFATSCFFSALAGDAKQAFAGSVSYTNDPFLILVGSMNYCRESFKQLEGSYSSLSEAQRQDAIQKLAVTSAANKQHVSEFLNWLANSPPLSEKQKAIALTFAENLQKTSLVETQTFLITSLKSNLALQYLKDITDLYSKVLPDRTLMQQYKSELQKSINLVR